MAEKDLDTQAQRRRNRVLPPEVRGVWASIGHRRLVTSRHTSREKALIAGPFLIGAPRFELGTSSPLDSSGGWRPVFASGGKWLRSVVSAGRAGWLGGAVPDVWGLFGDSRFRELSLVPRTGPTPRLELRHDRRVPGGLLLLGLGRRPGRLRRQAVQGRVGHTPDVTVGADAASVDGEPAIHPRRTEDRRRAGCP
jgi:hypothetical protein